MRLDYFQKKYREGYFDNLDTHKLARAGWNRYEIKDVDSAIRITKLFAMWINELKESKIISVENTDVMFEMESRFPGADYPKVILLILPKKENGYKRLDIEFIDSSIEIKSNGELLKTLKYYGDIESTKELVEWLNEKE